ncbi:hypothetical protein Bca4012_051632 [Brassica carinata]|uniref:Uncharacterized protein n=1 Tax=Brassica carinata TaxID=52824 RepID=A0A8X7R836_BRACI|nr:hypothetical protein Bca52824_054177 [Brassica carinata]
MIENGEVAMAGSHHHHHHRHLSHPPSLVTTTIASQIRLNPWSCRCRSASHLSSNFFVGDCVFFMFKCSPLLLITSKALLGLCFFFMLKVSPFCCCYFARSLLR